MECTASLVPALSGANRAAPPALVAVLCVVLPAAAWSQGDRAAGGIQDLSVEASCSAIEPGTWVARFTWPPSLLPADGALELSAYYKGFESGRFETIARLKPRASSFSWSGGNPGAEYLWRIRSGTGARMRVSDTARYQVPVCPVDYVEPRTGGPGKAPTSGPDVPVD